MCNYRMDIRGSIDLSDYSNIYDYIGIVDNNDDFTIALDGLDSDNINIICTMLTDNEFVIDHKGYDSTGVYYINASKR